MTHVRRWSAVVLVVALAVVAFAKAVLEPSPLSREPFVLWWSVGIGALLAAALGLGRGRWWGRWLGLAAGVACTLYAPMAILVASDEHRPLRSELAFLVGPLLLGCLSGRRMFQAFDAPAGLADDGRARLVRWTVITNLSGGASLLLGSFALLLVGRELGEVHTRPVMLMAWATCALLPGVVLLARQKTAGLLLVAVACALQIGALGRVSGDISHCGPGPALLVTGAILPGLATGIAVVATYARPIWRFLRR